jgi:hypothetical protein
MAKKKDGGSNLGLIITLVFFVLSTVILGVTTYMGYSDQEAKEKAKSEAEKKAQVAEQDKSWYRDQARIYESYAFGTQAPGVDATEVARAKSQLDGDQLSSAANQKDKDHFKKQVAKLNAMGAWDANKSTSPSQTLENKVQSLNQQIEGLRAELKKARDSVARANREKEEELGNAAKEIGSLKNALADLKAKANTDRQTDLKDLADKRAEVNKENQQANDLRKKLDDTAKELDKQNRRMKTMTADLAKTKKDLREANTKAEEYQTRLAALYEKSGQDPRAVEASTLDARAAEVLKEWRRDWRIVDMDRAGKMPYINLGSADALTPQITFSVHAAGLDGRLNPVAKGTVEVVRVIGSHLAQARVTSVKDAKKDPIVKGDRLFNPTWDPSRKRHVAIAGAADLGGEGYDNTEDLRKLLTRQGVVLDAYIDTKDDKQPKVAGKGITIHTDYLILADSLEGVNHPKARDKEYSARFDKLVRDMRETAATTGVTIITLRKYLDMIGYRAPKVLGNTGYGR